MTTTANDQPRADIRLHVRFEDSPYNSRSYSGERYAHVYAVPVILARDKYGEHRWDAHDPDSYSIDAEISEAVRALAGLKVSAQTDDSRASGSAFYGYGLTFEPARAPALRDIERVLPVMRKTGKRMTALAAKFGDPRDLPAFLAHLADAMGLGAQPFIRRADPDQDWEGTGYRSMDAGQLRYWLDDQLAAWHKRYGVQDGDGS